MVSGYRGVFSPAGPGPGPAPEEDQLVTDQFSARMTSSVAVSSLSSPLLRPQPHFPQIRTGYLALNLRLVCIVSLLLVVVLVVL